MIVCTYALEQLLLHTQISYHAKINIFALYIAIKETLLIKLTNAEPRDYYLGRFPNETILLAYCTVS